MPDRVPTQRQFRLLIAAVCVLAIGVIAGPITVYETRTQGNSSPPANAALVAPTHVAPTGTPRRTPDQPDKTAPDGGPPADPAHRPAYAISADVDPVSGRIQADMRVRVPADVGGDPLRFRVLPDAAGYDGGFQLDKASVDGHAARPELDGALLTLDRPDGDPTTVDLSFHYTVEQGQSADSGLGGLFGGESSNMVFGLLSRFDTGMSMGHWYPALLPGNALARPELPQEGDIGAAPAADVTAELTVPAGYSVISGGVQTRAHTDGDRLTVTHVGHGIRELSLVVSNQLKETGERVGGTRIRVWSTDSDVDAASRVAGYTARGFAVYSKDFGRYPWPELDVVEAPMPAGVGGMEWQGMFWVGPDMFSGDPGGLGGLGSLGGIDMRSMGEFTVAHELSHQWWQGIVGVDQVRNEDIDEPLAQFSACQYFKEVHPGDARAACQLNVTMNYQMMRLLGRSDAAADRSTYEFADDYSYAGIIYGKAPGFYDAVGKVIGEKRLLAGLQRLVGEHAFGVVRPKDVVAALQEAAPDRASDIARLWTRWMEEDHGDQDIGLNSGPLAGLGSVLGGGSDLGRILSSILGN